MCLKYVYFVFKSYLYYFVTVYLKLIAFQRHCSDVFHLSVWLALKAINVSFMKTILLLVRDSIFFLQNGNLKQSVIVKLLHACIFFLAKLMYFEVEEIYKTSILKQDFI
jgi:hypothetical protein